jgi:NTP pyrophosphatase (non-canonical NTP hydrolase)
MFDEFETFQYEHSRWLAHNFPNQLPHEPLLGLVEEVGELSHAHLKLAQGIRGTVTELMAKKEDAVGDIFIFLISYCVANNISLRTAIEDAWRTVEARDWRANPTAGSPAEGGTDVSS